MYWAHVRTTFFFHSISTSHIYTWSSSRGDKECLKEIKYYYKFWTEGDNVPGFILGKEQA